jgi:toxin FitB
MPQGWLLDTNVVSETTRSRPDAGLMSWLDGLDAEQMHVSVLTIGELHKGVLMLRDTKRRNKLTAWLNGALPDWFGERVLGIDLATAQRWAELLAMAGRPLPAIDSLLAATALRHGLGLVTRNLRDFGFPGLVVHSPWAQDP